MALMDFPEGASGTIPPASVTNAQLANMPALTVKVNATNASATPQDLAAGVADQMLARVGTALVFTGITTNMITAASIARTNNANSFSVAQRIVPGAAECLSLEAANCFVAFKTAAAVREAYVQKVAAGDLLFVNETPNFDVRFNITTSGYLRTNGGVYTESATGGGQGVGTANFSAVYDDGVLICAPFHDDMTQADWDALVVSDAGAREVTVAVVPGWFDRALEWLSFGIVKTATREIKQVVRESETGKREHVTAKRYFRMRAAGFNDKDLHAYVAYAREHKVVPGLIGVAEWSERVVANGVIDKPSVTEKLERVMLALDCAVVALGDASDRIAALEARVAKLEARR